MADALAKLMGKLTVDHGFNFKPPREDGNLYLKMKPELLPANDCKLLLAIDVYGIFIKPETKIAYLQCEITSYRAYPLVDFDNVVVHNNNSNEKRFQTTNLFESSWQ